MTRIVLTALLLLAASACAPQPKTATVSIDQFQFTPSLLEIPVGTTVVWTNRDAILHTVTSGSTRAAGLGAYDASPDGRVEGRLDGTGTVFSFTFDRPGTYAYYCDRHRHMIASVVVK